MQGPSSRPIQEHVIGSHKTDWDIGRIPKNGNQITRLLTRHRQERSTNEQGHPFGMNVLLYDDIILKLMNYLL